VATVLLRHANEIGKDTHEAISVGVAGSSMVKVMFNETEGDVHLNIYMLPDIYSYSVQLGDLQEGGELYTLFEREVAIQASTFIVGQFINECALAGNGFTQAVLQGLNFTKAVDIAASIASMTQAIVKALEQAQEEEEQSRSSFTDFISTLEDEDE